MDSRNLFETPATYRLHRLEYLAAFVALVVIAIMHVHQTRIWVFIGLFAYIDLIGYVPGAIVAHRRKTGYIPRIFYILYNTMHSFLTEGLIAGLWCLIVRPEWALLAIPIHLFADRGIVGNSLKPFGVPFEPQEHPAYYVVRPLLDRPRHPRATAESLQAAAVGSTQRGTLTDARQAR
jgi:hypothetical protein